MTVLETLTALYKNILIGLACFGCGQAGIALSTEEIRKSFEEHP
jgi:hypothetical protein